jgi:hypothetical protein
VALTTARVWSSADRFSVTIAPRGLLSNFDHLHSTGRSPNWNLRDEACWAEAAAYARDRNLCLTDIAQAAIDGALDPLACTPHYVITDAARLPAACEAPRCPGPGDSRTDSLLAKEVAATAGPAAAQVRRTACWPVIDRESP